MITGTVAVHRGEPFTRRELLDWIEARAMNVFTSRLDNMIETERGNCERAESLEQLKTAQGALAALRRVRSLPEILLNEATRAGA